MTSRADLFGADRVAFPAVLRSGLRDLQDHTCFYCNEHLAGPAAVDHFLPWSRWPNNAVENLVLAHDGCNAKKSDHVPGPDPLRHWGDRLADHGGDWSDWRDARTCRTGRPARWHWPATCTGTSTLAHRYGTGPAG